MRKISVLIGLCMIVALVLTAFAQQRDLDPVMKELGPAFNSLRMSLMANDGAKAAADAAKVEGLLKETETFFNKEKMSDAAKVAKDAHMAAAETGKAAKAGNIDAANKASAGIGKCKACHDLHREQLPDKSYRLKK